MRDITFQEIKKSLPGVKRNVSLAKYTTFKIGGKAKYFFKAKTKKDIIEAVKVAKKLNLPFFVLAGGSNLLVSDKGFRGLVIKTQNSKLKTQNHNSKLKTIWAEAGAELKDLVKISLEKSLTGLEWAAGIPGAIGGAIRGNAAAFNNSIGEKVKEVEVFDVKTEKILPFKRKDCKFGYRNSIFKRNKNLIILSAQIQLKEGEKKEIKKTIEKFLNYRKEKHPLDLPSAGSIFKNQKTKIKNQKLLEKYPELKEFSKNHLIPAGFLIEKAGLKGKKAGQAQISKKHANFIVNLGKAKAKDILELINLTKKKVKEKFKIKLEEEIEYLGF